MKPEQWVVMIEQLVLFVLILGRWMLPKGNISRDELSQLLLVYIGMAADIIECKFSLIMVYWALNYFYFLYWLTNIVVNDIWQLQHCGEDDVCNWYK